MEKELVELKEKILEFCKKYDLRKFEVKTIEIIEFTRERTIVNDISLKIEV